MTAVNFSHYERYDITLDCEKTVFTATTSKGSWWAEVPSEGAAKYRERRDKFKEFVADCITNDIEPGEVDLDG